MTRNDLQEDQLSSYTIHASEGRDSSGTIEMHRTSNSAYPNQDHEQCSSISHARGRIHQTGSQDPKKQQPTDLSPGRKRRQRQKHEAEVRPVEKHSWFRRPDKKTRTLTHTKRFFQTGELTLEPCRQWHQSPNPCPDFHFFGTF